MSFEIKVDTLETIKLETIKMEKKVIYEGIEMSLPVYDARAVIILEYLERVVTRLKENLNLPSGLFRLTLRVTFLPGAQPKHKVNFNGRTPKLIVRLLSKSIEGNYDRITGTVTVHLLVKD